MSETESQTTQRRSQTVRRSIELGQITAVITIIAALFGAFFFLENRYAYNDALVKLEMRLEKKILKDRIANLQEEVWRFQDRCEASSKKGETCGVSQELRKREKRLEKAEDELKAHRNKKPQ